MSTERVYRAQPERVVHETIDGEAVIVDLDTGIYHSLTGAGAEIWTLLAAGWSVDLTAAAIAARWSADPGTVRSAVDQLATDLVEANLLEATVGADPAPDAEALPSSQPNGEFEMPELHTYSDMEYFLLLDPVHDVPAVGWPHAVDPAQSVTDQAP